MKDRGISATRTLSLGRGELGLGFRVRSEGLGIEKKRRRERREKRRRRESGDRRDAIVGSGEALYSC